MVLNFLADFFSLTLRFSFGYSTSYPCLSYPSNPSLLKSFLLHSVIFIIRCLANIIICLRAPALSCTLITLLPTFSWFVLIISHTIKPFISILVFQTSSVTCVRQPSQTQKKRRTALGCYQSRRTDLHVEHVFSLFFLFCLFIVPCIYEPCRIPPC